MTHQAHILPQEDILSFCQFRKISKYSVASTLPEPGLLQPTVVRVVGYNHRLLLIVQHRTQHGAAWAKFLIRKCLSSDWKQEGTCFAREKSFLHACFVQHEKTRTLAS